MRRRLVPLLLSMLIAGIVCAEQDLTGSEQSLIYSPIGKRDPFRTPSTSLTLRDLAAMSAVEKYSIEQLQLRAILKGEGKSRAMFEDPEGRTHIVGEGELVGREKGTISRILSSSVIVTERTFNYLGAENLYEKVISLPDESDQVVALPSPSRKADNFNVGPLNKKY